MMKRMTAVLFLLVLAVPMIFATGTTETQTKEPTVRAALITNPRGTSAYINEGIAGFEEACARWGIDGTVVECKGTAEYEENTRAAANEGYNLILAGSWEAGSIVSELADIYDEISFGIIDTLTDSQRVKCIQYYEAEGAYLVGVIAALTVDGESHNYGCINVTQSKSSWKWRYGYAQGVLSIDPQAKFTYNYVYGYSEVNLAYELALQQYELGCKFINSCAAGGDSGTFAAAKEKGFYTSGQDVDTTDAQNPWIVTSQIKGANPSIQYMVDKYMENDWDSENEYLGVADGAIGAVWATQDSVNPMSNRLSSDDIAKIKNVVAKLSSGEINMRTLPEEAEGLIPLI
ncbi:MAG: BMP family ABC transporter substrate-binding protein [Sphaerochaetaceae bacterium]